MNPVLELPIKYEPLIYNKSYADDIELCCGFVPEYFLGLDLLFKSMPMYGELLERCNLGDDIKLYLSHVGMKKDGSGEYILIIFFKNMEAYDVFFLKFFDEINAAKQEHAAEYERHKRILTAQNETAKLNYQLIMMEQEEYAKKQERALRLMKIADDAEKRLKEEESNSWWKALFERK